MSTPQERIKKHKEEMRNHPDHWKISAEFFEDELKCADKEIERMKYAFRAIKNGVWDKERIYNTVDYALRRPEPMEDDNGQHRPT